MTVHFDPLDPDVRRDPYPAYARLRRTAPVCALQGGGFALSRYGDVRKAFARPDLFSSLAMRALIERADEGSDDEPFPETLIGSDPPTHTGLRKLVNRGFSRRRVAQLEARVRAISTALVDSLAEREGFDLVADFAAPLTVRVIAELLGVDPERHEDFRRWSDALLLLVSGAPSAEEFARAQAEKQELSDYLDQTIETRRRKPQDDLISAFVRLEAEGGPLGESELGFLPHLLLIAGNETTTHLIGNLMTALLAHPAQQELLAARPELIPAAIEEGLRFDSPIQLVLRTTTRALEIADVNIPAGRTVALLIGSANRDERVFARPDRFDITRDASAHLSFGLGTHFCLGAPLARLEGRIALEALLPLGLRAAGPRGDGIASLLVRGAQSIPVRRSARLRCAS